MLQLIFYNRATVSELKNEVRSLILREGEPAPLLSPHTSGKSLSFCRSHSHMHTCTIWLNCFNHFLFLFSHLVQVHHLSHSLAALEEGSELKRQSRTLTLKTLAQLQVWLRSAQMICHGWRTKTQVRTNVFSVKNEPKHGCLVHLQVQRVVQNAESSMPCVSIISFSQAFCPAPWTPPPTHSDNWITRESYARHQMGKHWWRL